MAAPLPPVLRRFVWLPGRPPDADAAAAAEARRTLSLAGGGGDLNNQLSFDVLHLQGLVWAELVHLMFGEGSTVHGQKERVEEVRRCV